MYYFFSSGTASDSICPKGWRLPENSGDDSFLELLKSYSNRNGNQNFTNADSVVQITLLSFLRSGFYYYSTGVPTERASNGFYWSSSRDSRTNGYRLSFNSTYLRPQGGDSRGRGFALRCLARIEPKENSATLLALLLILYVPKVGDYRKISGMGRMMI